jgi:HK97 family phage major capsid protein
MTPEEIARAEKEALLKEIKGIITDATKDSASKPEVDAKIEEKLKSINERIAKLPSDEIDSLKVKLDELAKKNEALENASKKQGEEMVKLKSGQGQNVAPKSLYQIAENAIMKYKDVFLTEKTDTNGSRLSMLDWFNKGNQTSPKFELTDGATALKVAVDMGIDTVAQSNVPLLRLTTLVPGVFGNPLSIYPHVLDYFPQRPCLTSLSMLVSYSYTDGTQVQPEGNASGKSSLLLKTVEFPTFRVSTYISMTDKMLDNLPEALAEISRIAPDKVKSRLDEFVYRTTGDDSTTIKGMFSAAKSTAFVADTYADSVVGANYIDLIEAMVLQCELSEYQPGVLGLNPSDIRIKFNSLKNQLDDSVKDNRVTFTNGKLSSVCGLSVVASPKITANTCFVGAIMDVALLGINKNLTLEIGLNGTDFVEGQKTARIGMDVAFGVGDPLGIIYCSDMTTDLDTIKKIGI